MDFEVVRIEPVRLEGPRELLEKNLMSPFAWTVDDGEGALRVLVRAVPPHKTESEESGRLWFGEGEPDGLTFRMQEQPLITPGPGPDDIKGCEDPTVVQESGRYIIYYTGVEDGGAGNLCHLEGEDMDRLEKRGIALKSTRSDKNTKEATLLRSDDTWRLLFEYAHGGRSRIGLAFSPEPQGPWTEQADPFSARPDKWDKFHLSTGPLLRTDPKRPVMFYNGADEDADWGIGWVALTKDLTAEVERCDGPLISPPKDPTGSCDLVFAASLVLRGEDIWLYYSKNDRELFRATLRQV